MFYLARSTITLAGHQKYYIRSDSADFVPKIFTVLNPTKHRNLISKYGNAESIEYKNEHVAYTITLDVGLTGNAQSIKFDSSRVESHRYIWNQYHALDVRQLNLTPLIAPNGTETFEYLVKERNRENYSFEGYRQLDFNLPMPTFEAYFERDFVKRAADTLYDETAGLTLIGFQEIYNLLQDLGVSGFSLEQEKFAYMVEYTLDDSEARSKLLDLCRRGFPLQNEYRDEDENRMWGDY